MWYFVDFWESGLSEWKSLIYNLMSKGLPIVACMEENVEENTTLNSCNSSEFIVLN